MNVPRNVLNALMRPAGVVLVITVIASLVLATLAYRQVLRNPQAPQAIATVRPPTPTPTLAPTLVATPTPTPTPIVLPPQSSAQILGIDVGGPGTDYPGVTWVRMGYPTCGWGNLQGQVLKDTMQAYHSKGIRVLFVMCQSSNTNYADATPFVDTAQARPDAVQCGNEQMKQDAAVSFLYVSPDKFAQFYDLCEHAIHAVNPATPVLLGSIDPHVAADDYQLMVNQANYLDQVQNTMNTTIHPGGNWDWHNQALGVIDSWHNGYIGPNNLAGVFNFWAQQFHVDTNGGQLGKHLWVVEGTACYKGCGLNNDTEVGISHILTLITDVQTTMQAQVPFFFFSGEDINNPNDHSPIGVLDSNGHSKPLRQDLPMGARVLTLSCPDGSQPSVGDQEQLLTRLYNHCTLPANYVSILAN